MYRDILSRVEGIDIFPLIGLVIFFTFFVVLLFWVTRLSRNYIDTMENMPLDAPGGPSVNAGYAGNSGSADRPAGLAAATDNTAAGRKNFLDDQPNNRNPE
jgi:cytochrome c oxidase cbb3-type subunit IV